jgi:3-oxoadipate enol-lactonase
VPTHDLGAITLYAERSGTGARLLFVSGTGGDLRNKPSVFSGPLGPRFEILAYDQRGLGRSAVPDGPYTMADYAKDAAGLLKQVGWDSCLVVGVSFPELVQRLVLACSSSGGPGGASIPFTELEQLEGMARVERQLELMDTRWNPERRRTHQAEWTMMVEVMTAYGRDDDPSAARAKGSALQLEARSQHDTWDRLGQISCPTLICAGRYDGIAPPENSERMASQIPGAALDFFEGGHQFLWQDRRAFDQIIAFLRG